MPTIANPRLAVATVAEISGLPMPKGPLLVCGDDQNCAELYREFMEHMFTSPV